jgi:parallel beta-helix repeat protein
VAKVIVWIGITALMAVSVNATIINIPRDYDTIQKGIDHGQDGDTVLVQPDTYKENINFYGRNVVLASLFLTTGDTAYISTTIIDGNQSGSVVIFSSGEDSTAKIVGLTIRNGHDCNGGGIYCSHSSPTISHNLIVGNSSEGSYFDGGGGVYCFGSSPIIRNNRISGNSARPNGGGVYCRDGSRPLIVGNLITGNSVHGPGGTGARGGGIGCTRSCPRIANNTITGNSASYYGGGISCWYDSNCSIVNNIICGNRAMLNGGGIHCNSDSSPTITNTTISENRATGRGGGICCHWDSTPTITNTILWGDSSSTNAEIYVRSSTTIVTYCDVQGGWTGEGNIDADPLFCDPEDSDFHLQDSIGCGHSLFSPCIDAGHPDSLDLSLSCFSGLGTDRSDIGAYGGSNSGWPTGEGED